MKIVIFLIGIVIGSIIGIVSMCLVQINRQSENELKKAEQSYSEISSEAKD